MKLDNSKLYTGLSYPNIYPHDNSSDVDNQLYTKELFDKSALNKLLLQSNISNYNNLHATQCTTFDIAKFSIKFSDFKRLRTKQKEFNSPMYPKKYIYYIDYDFVHISVDDEFKDSDLYDTIINQSIISNRLDIFRNNYIVFLNGNMLNNTEIIIDDCRIGIIINIGSPTSTDCITTDEFAEFVNNNKSVTICIVPNFTTSYISIPTKLTNISDFNTQMYSVLKNNSIVSYNNGSSKLNTFLQISESQSVIDIFSDIIDTTSTTDEMFKLTKYVNMMFMNFVDKPIKLSITGEYFQLPNFEMPIPVSNMLTFGGDDYKYCENENITLYYPNIYKLSTDMKSYDIYIYYMSFSGVGERYRNDISLYSNNIPDILDEYRNNTVPDIIKTYQPLNFEYSIPDYEHDNSTSSSILSYKLSKLVELMNDNYTNIVNYMNYIIPNNKIYINMRKMIISDLLRTDTHLETPDTIVKFNTEKVLITLSKSLSSITISGFRIFIDGFFVPMESIIAIKHNDSYYIYIDKSFITNTSIIEIEKYVGYDDRSAICMTKNNNTIEFNKPTARLFKSDIYAIDSNTKEIIDDSNYDIYLNIDNIGFVKVIDDYRLIDNNFKVVYKGNIEDRIISIIARKKLIRTIEYISGRDTATYTIGSMMNHDNPSPSNYRFFRNRRLIDMSKYIKLSQSKTTVDTDKFILTFRNNIGDSLIIDKTSDYRELIYSQDDISDNGFVEILSEIKFPINLRWYDIYLNGLKLTPFNIDIISSNSFYIKNVSTKKDLRIYLVNLSILNPFIPPIDASKDINNKLMDIPSFRSIIDSKYPNIQETMDDVVPDDIKLTDDDMRYVDLYKDYLCSNFINANIPQITDEIKEKYPDMIDDDGILYLDATPHSDKDIIFMLNSNITLKE